MGDGGVGVKVRLTKRKSSADVASSNSAKVGLWYKTRTNPKRCASPLGSGLKLELGSGLRLGVGVKIRGRG